MSVKKSSRPREGHLQGPLERRDAIFTNLLLLGFDRSDMEGKFNVPFTKDMFAVPNKKCFEVVMHFLFEKLNLPMAQDRFRYCWPITDKKQEQAFRKVVNSWLTEIKEEEDCNLPRIVPSLFLSPGGDKFDVFLLHFSRYVVNKVIFKEIGVKERDLLYYPQLPSKDSEFGEQIGRALEACCVRHRRSFLSHLHRDLLLQDQWSSYASELAAEYRQVGKKIRELEAQIKEEEARLMAQAKVRGSPSVTRRRRSGALLDAEWDTMAVTRTQKVQKVREMWKTVAICQAAQRQELEVVESILEGAANRYRVDGSELRVQVPEMLLRECHKELEKRNIDNTYEGGKLNLLSLIQLWNLSLRLYLEKLHQAPMADYETLQPEVVTQVHTHHAHLTNLQALRSSMGQEVLPSVKSSIGSLKRTLHLGHEAPTRQRATNSNSIHFLGDSLGLLPATPPVSFEPASAAQASDDTPTRPMNKAFWKASPTVNTPEAVSSLVNNVNQAVYKQSHLTQGTPTSTLRLLREQINRPSKLPKPAPTKAPTKPPTHDKMERRRVKSAPCRTQELSLSEDESTLKLEEASPFTPHHAKREVKTQPRKVTKQSKLASVQKTKKDKPSAKKSEIKPGSSKSESRTASTPSIHSRTPVNSQPLHQHTTTSVTRAHQDLIDQIADVVVGAMNGSPEWKGLMESPLSLSPGHSESPVPLGIEDPLSVLDQSAFVTRDKLKHSPVTTPSHPISTPRQHPASPLVRSSTASNARSPESDDVASLEIVQQSSSIKQRTSNGSQKSVTFSDHVDEHNISTLSYGSDLNDSSMNGDVFASNTSLSSPAMQSGPELSHFGRNGQTPVRTFQAKWDDGIAESYLSPSPEHHKTSSGVEHHSPLNKLFTLDDTNENGQDDFLLDTSDRLEDLLVHVSPSVTPSATPKLNGTRIRSRYPQDIDDSSPSLSIPARQSEPEVSHPILNDQIPSEVSLTSNSTSPGSVHTCPSSEHRKTHDRFTPNDKPFALDNTFENGEDEFLLDTSHRLEDLLVHVSPLISPSATPNLNGKRSRISHPSDTSISSASRPLANGKSHWTSHSNDSFHLTPPANISSLSLGDVSPFSANDASLLKDMSSLKLKTPGSKTPLSSYKASPSSQSQFLQATPKTTLDFDLLDEDDSVLLPPSPYNPSPSSKSPSGSVGQLINF
ncbi:mucin-2-like [Lytechinus pictus]|uniref:mucin-2-like n=1 Tax=Lytechinus pictus TaxID=7653 RepID=UPI0030BA0E86